MAAKKKYPMEVRFTLARSSDLATQRARAKFAAPLLSLLADLEGRPMKPGVRGPITADRVSIVAPVLLAMFATDSNRTSVASPTPLMREWLAIVTSGEHLTAHEAAEQGDRGPAMRVLRRLVTAWISDAAPTIKRTPAKRRV